MQDFWNERYAGEDYAYGKSPNAYFKSVIDDLPPGKMLMPGAGEGRDAVYAAQLGWQVDAFDFSAAGQAKALKLATDANVSINFQVLNVADFAPPQQVYDFVALIFFHLPSVLRRPFHQKVAQTLRPGGYVLLEAFSPEQLPRDSGGPKNRDMLMSKADVKAEFSELQMISLEAPEIELDEGAYHQGLASVIRFLGQKK